MSKHKPLNNTYIFVGLLVISLACIIVILITSQEQDKKFIEDYQIFMAAQQLEKKGNYDDAEKLIQRLLPQYQKNYQVQWHYGTILLNQKKYTEAEEQMRLAREIRPALVMTPRYLYEYGQISYYLNNLEVAERYLLESQKYNQPEINKKSRELLEVVAKGKKG
ncbi:tetratricopeptide repeat protein [Desulfotomaculum sp. 1211_IL3151]|uniref:tetratricopeptide repeat protein n=1 Tax=Desulfotomaculum sp. 1211_IL3151 TaxID=3084055 RepID=UPI002FD8A6F8